MAAPTTTIQEVKSVLSLWYKIHVFVYDLRNFNSIPASQARLDECIDPSYIGLPYFSPSEVSLLKSLTVLTPGTSSTTASTATVAPSTVANDEGQTTQSLEQLISDTLDLRLSRRMKKRIASEDFRVCTAHDLAPVFEMAFAIKPKELARDKGFIDLVGRVGLKIGAAEEEWGGVVVRLSKGGKGGKGGKKNKRR